MTTSSAIPSTWRQLHRRVLLIISIGILALWLVSCGEVREEVTIRSGERWKMELHTVISPDELIWIGGTAEIERQLEDLRNDPEAAGANYKWSKKLEDDGSVIYIVEQSGEGFQDLSSAAFDDHATFSFTTVENKDAVHFIFDPRASFGELGRYELVLHAGSVLETNGEMLDKGTVRWVGANRQMEAVFRLSRGVSPAAIGGLVALLLLAGAAVALIRSRQRAGQAVIAASPRYCHQCGVLIETAGKFGPSCGAPRL